MKFTQLTDEEVGKLSFANRTGQANKYTPLLEAAKKGPIRVNVEEGSNIQSLKWAISKQVKTHAPDEIEMITLADKSGVVLRPKTSEPKPDEKKK